MTDYTVKQISDAIDAKLMQSFGRDRAEGNVGREYIFRASAQVLRDIMSQRQVGSAERDVKARQVHYLSMEFLVGRSLAKNAFNLGVLPQLTKALKKMGFEPSDVFEAEPDAGLGNGGLGRLAACYMDSMTTLDIPATGYSICYELGVFRQKIVDGQQVELPENWLELGESWLIPHMDEAREVRFGGHVDYWDDNGKLRVKHEGYSAVLAVPRDMLIAGYDTERVNTLRLWDAKSPTSLDMSLFSRGEYLRAIEQRAMAEVLAKVLYPEDNHYEGKSLRLKQQYFFVSATVQSIVAAHRAEFGTVKNFADKHVIQINDTHPALVIPELMRILMDEDELGWDEAWDIVTKAVAYTNHTVLSEALERWPQGLVESLLPRIWNILEEINRRYIADLTRLLNGDMSRVSRMAVIWDGDVRMANLCICACFSINGVSALHSEILRKDLFVDAASMTPARFKNVTNGIDHRRWLTQSNPRLHSLIHELAGDAYLTKPGELRKLESFSGDKAVLEKLAAIKHANKLDFADYLHKSTGILLNTDAIFDVQVKRLHEYKRQLLNVIHICHLYNVLRDDPDCEFMPRVFIFGAKAAAGYAFAKRIIRLICSLSEQINNDPICKGKLQVVFLENYRVSLAEHLMPAAEVSEQISTAGKEASGTGNMKFMMNGALTIGTMDGANVEIFEAVGAENMFLFGMNAEEVAEKRKHYDPASYFYGDGQIRRVLERFTSGFDDGVSYSDITQKLIFGAGGSSADEYMLLADYASYREAQLAIAAKYPDKEAWNRSALINIARSGIFAADRSISDYADTIWNVKHK